MTPSEQQKIVSKLVDAAYEDGNRATPAERSSAVRTINEVIAAIRGPRIVVPCTTENYEKLAKHLVEELDADTLKELAYTYILDGYEKSRRQFCEDYEGFFEDTVWGNPYERDDDGNDMPPVEPVEEPTPESVIDAYWDWTGPIVPEKYRGACPDLDLADDLAEKACYIASQQRGYLMVDPAPSNLDEPTESPTIYPEDNDE